MNKIELIKFQLNMANNTISHLENTREIFLNKINELKKQNKLLQEKLKIAEEFIEFLANGKCSSDVCKLQSREYKNCLVCFENKAEEVLQKMKEV